MLFDLRSRGRRRTVQAVYLWLAIIMGGGLILFGIGGATSGGLLDAFKGGGGGNATNTFDQAVANAQQRTRQRPRDPAAWAALTRAQYQRASAGDGYDQANGTFTPRGLAELRGAASSWQRYLALNPRPPDGNLAATMVQAYAALNQAAPAVAAQQIVIDRRGPSSTAYQTLAQLAYAAGQTRKGDLAAQQAVDLAPRDQRVALRQRLAQLKQQAAKQAQGGAGTSGGAPGAASPAPSPAP